MFGRSEGKDAKASTTDVPRAMSSTIDPDTPTTDHFTQRGGTTRETVEATTPLASAAPLASTGFSIGATSRPIPAPFQGFNAPAAPVAGGFGFTASSSAPGAPVPGGFGFTAASVASGFGFSATPSTPVPGGFGFGAAMATPVAGGFGFSATTAALVPGGFGFGGRPPIPAFCSCCAAKMTPTAAPFTVPRPFRRVDKAFVRVCYLAGPSSVVGDYDVVLSRTTETDATTFFRIQLIHQSNRWNVFTRWGREDDDEEESEFDLGNPWQSLDAAINDFCQKFEDKTLTKWADRATCEPVAGAYVRVDDKQEAANCVASHLPPRTQTLVQTILDEDMFTTALLHTSLDTKRMPFGAVSLDKIKQAAAVADSIRQAIDGGDTPPESFEAMSAQYYTLLPQRWNGSVINLPGHLSRTYDNLAILHDVAVAQDLVAALGPAASLDDKYAALQCDLDLVEPDNSMHDVIWQLMAHTKGTSAGFGWTRKVNVHGIWSVRRPSEDESFAAFASTPNHRLLWYGANMAGVAAILSSGLRIVALSGSPVGHGIALTNMLDKAFEAARGTVVDGSNVECLFLVEVALGNMHEIRNEEPTLTKPPPGYDSVWAKGSQSPNPDGDKVVQLDGRDVLVSVGCPMYDKFSSSVHHRAETDRDDPSAFLHDHFVVYQESQLRLRYIVVLSK